MGKARTAKRAKQEVPALSEAQAQGHAEVWRMLLLELWDEPCSDPAVVCRLLCVSKAMSALVHDTCRGKLVLHIKQHQLSTATEAALTCSWLAKHAQLLQELHVDISEQPADRAEWVAAGLRAAAQVASVQPARTRQQSLVRAAQIIQSAEDTAGAATRSAAALSTTSSTEDKQGGVHQRQIQKQQGAHKQSAHQQAHLYALPLLRFSIRSGDLFNVTIISTLAAACMQLTKLHLLRRTGTRYVPQSLPPGLQQLRGLHELVCDYRTSFRDDYTWLQRLHQLTKLHMPHDMFPAPTAQHIPVSVTDLNCPMAVSLAGDLRRLTNLRSLQCLSVLNVTYLPQQLRSLAVHDVAWHEGYLQLPQLRCFKYEQEYPRDDFPDVAPFSRMTQLTAFKLVLDAVGPPDDGDFAQLFETLPRLPLVQLHVRNNMLLAEDVSLVAQCTKLTSLLLRSVYAKVDVGVIAQQLQKLQSLQELTWDRVQLRPHYRGYWGDGILLNPLVDALTTLAGKSLRSVYFRGFVLSDEQEERLQQALGGGWDYQPEQIDSDFLLEDSSDEDGWDTDGEGEGGWNSDSDGWEGSDGWDGGWGEVGELSGSPGPPYESDDPEDEFGSSDDQERSDESAGDGSD